MSPLIMHYDSEAYSRATGSGRGGYRSDVGSWQITTIIVVVGLLIMVATQVDLSYTLTALSDTG